MTTPRINVNTMLPMIEIRMFSPRSCATTLIPDQHEDEDDELTEGTTHAGMVAVAARGPKIRVGGQASPQRSTRQDETQGYRPGQSRVGYRRSMAHVYSSAEQFEALFTAMFDEIAAVDPDGMNELIDQRMVICFQLRDPELELWIDGSEKPVRTMFGHQDLDATLTGDLTGDSMHELLLGTLPLGRAADVPEAEGEGVEIQGDAPGEPAARHAGDVIPPWSTRCSRADPSSAHRPEPDAATPSDHSARFEIDRYDRGVTDPKIIYTHTDEAPALATYSLLPIVEAFAGAAGVALEKRDISLAGRILSQFPDFLGPDQQQSDDLAELGRLATTPEANIIKLPNVSASMPQMEAAITELQAKGYALPDYPDDPSTDAERDIKARYDRVKGSAVNPVLREGNSDRRAPKAVKEYARKNPHSMGAWSADSKTHVATMGHDDFRSNEQSVTMESADDLRIEFVDATGDVAVLKESVPVQAGEIVDATFMSTSALRTFLREQIADARRAGHPLLAPHEGDHDEGLRSDHLRPRGLRVLRPRVRTVR